MSDTKIAAQLYIFRDRYDLGRDLDGIFESLAEAGYDAVEGFDGQPSDRHLLDRHGLNFVGPHVVLAALESPDSLIAGTLSSGGAMWFLPAWCVGRSGAQRTTKRRRRR
jgi:hypothetical protein